MLTMEVTSGSLKQFVFIVLQNYLRSPEANIVETKHMDTLVNSPH